MEQQADFLAAYAKLEQERRNWWAPFAKEGVLLKLIVGAFLLYMGYMVVTLVGVAVLVLLYTIFVVGVVWYGIDLLRQQYAAQQRHYEQERAKLARQAEQALLRHHLAKAAPGAQLTTRRRLHGARSLLPYIWGVSPEQWQQYDHFEVSGVSVATLLIEQEAQPPLAYWLLGTPVALAQDPDESTALLPKPFAHDRWTPVQFNTSLEPPEFRAQYRWFTSSFWHSYQVARGAVVRHMMALSDGPASTFLVVRKGWLYVAVARGAGAPMVTLPDWEGLAARVEAQAGAGVALARQVAAIAAAMTPPSE